MYIETFYGILEEIFRVWTYTLNFMCKRLENFDNKRGFMEKLVITGKTSLKGEVNISGAKNAAIAILPATLLIDGVCTIHNLPNIADVKIFCDILVELGAKINWLSTNSIEIDTSHISCTTAPLDLTRKFRASYYLIGSMLGRCKKVQVSLPRWMQFGSKTN